MSLSIIKKKRICRKSRLLSTNFGALDNHFYIDGESQSYPAGIAHFLEHKLFEDEQGRDVTLILSSLELMSMLLQPWRRQHIIFLPLTTLRSL